MWRCKRAGKQTLKLLLVFKAPPLPPLHASVQMFPSISRRTVFLFFSFSKANTTQHNTTPSIPAFHPSSLLKQIPRLLFAAALRKRYLFVISIFIFFFYKREKNGKKHLILIITLDRERSCIVFCLLLFFLFFFSLIWHLDPRRYWNATYLLHFDSKGFFFLFPVVRLLSKEI